MFDPVQAIIDLCRAPSVSTDPQYRDGMTAARDVLTELFASMGLTVETIPTPLHDAVMAKREGPAEWPHVLIYGHYDVQPPDPLPEWETPPFAPVVKEGTLYGRGVADNKGPMMVHIAGLARLLEKQPDLPLRVTFLIEGEEEIGSPNFSHILRHHAEQLKADFCLLSDTVSPSAEQIAITTGLRGMVALEIEMFGPSHDLHSGLFGGAIRNPLEAMMRLCASLHTPEGRVDIPGFYDGVTSPEAWEREELARYGLTDADLAKSVGVSALRPFPGYTGSESTRFQPTLEFNGIGGGYQGEGDKTIIPGLCQNQLPPRAGSGPGQGGGKGGGSHSSALLGPSPPPSPPRSPGLGLSRGASGQARHADGPESAPRECVSGDGHGGGGCLWPSAALPARRRECADHR